ncbi:hypothetical protein KY289_003214 [Solanum tuberosum]|nr:hypothetical protein KY289_003214 [Solanum tuberosum]
MKKNLMMMVEGSIEELDVKLELIDNIERLGVSYHFKNEIMQILKSVHDQINIFNDFKDVNGDVKQTTESESETTLRNVTRFTEAHLKNYVYNHSCGHQYNNIMMELVVHALELPRHWMMPRLETRWYISIYERMPNANPLLLELAKLDFNIVQATHQHDLKILSRWWKNICLAEKLSFSRNRLVENLFWAVGKKFEPQHSYFRRLITKIIVFVGIIDDIYDVYGTLDELELFTLAVQRMEVNAMDELPDYMKVCYLALFNTTTEIAYEVLKEQGINVMPYLTNSWGDLCKSYLREARWYHSGYKPNLEEYMENGWISIAAPMVLVHALLLVTNPITKEALDSLTNYSDIIRWSATIIRLTDDLGTSSDEMERGDVPKSIQCCMNEKGVSEEDARIHINLLIKETWKLMSTVQKDNSLFSETFIGCAVNGARTSQTIYQHGDGHGIQNSHIKHRIFQLFFEPITISIP